jgi:hypothetical protein
MQRQVKGDERTESQQLCDALKSAEYPHMGTSTAHYVAAGMTSVTRRTAQPAGPHLQVVHIAAAHYRQQSSE